MGCGLIRAHKTHPAPSTAISALSVVPDSPTKEAPVCSFDDSQAEQTGLPADQDTNKDEDDCDNDEDDDEDSDESMPGEPVEAKWARAAKRKKKLARQRRRAAKAAKQNIAVEAPIASISSFTGIRRPDAKPEKEGCFDRQCFLASSRGMVDEIYDISINLGKGTFGIVERCTHRKTKEQRAIKTIAKKKVYHPDRLADEVEVMRMLEHPNILKLYESFEDDKYIYIVMELCYGGELLEKVVGLTGGLSEIVVAKVMKQVVSAVYYMHQQLICHRDLKPENFLLTKEVEDVADAHIKVIDFGFATRFQPGDFMSTRACTNNYVAPEVLEGKYTEACDVWSLGVIIYVLLSGQKPFWGASESEMLSKVQRCVWDFDDPPCWTSTSEDAKDLIRRILVLDISQRLSAIRVLQHRWIAQLAPRASFDPLPQEVMSRLHSFHLLGKFSRAAMTAVAQQLPEDSIQQLRQIFEALDEDGDGSLSMAEVERGLKLSGVEVPKDLQQSLQNVDSDGSGMVDYTEFLAATLDEKHHLQDAVCWAAFRVFDVDGDGKITKDELASMLSCGRAAGLAEMLGAERAEIEQAVAEADLDGDHCIDFEEFQSFLRSTCARKSASAALPNAVAA